MSTDMVTITHCVICERKLKADRDQVDTCGKRCFNALLRRQRAENERIELPPYCNVVGAGCDAPPAFADSHARATCFACGLAVCSNANCSRLVTWHRYGRRRVCLRCIEDRDRLR